MSKLEELCQIIECLKTQTVQTATRLTGEKAGEKIIFSKGEWLNKDSGAKELWDVVRSSEREAVCGIIKEEGNHIFFDTMIPDQSLVICGAGHVSLALIPMAKAVGFHVTAIDDRPTFTNLALSKGADEVICKDFGKALKEISGGMGTYFVVVTRGHRYDEQCLKEIYEKKFAYLGMMGSKGRVLNIRRNLEKMGKTKEEINLLHAPIGLPIGAQTPEEIAVSILAELISVKREGKEASHGAAEIYTTVKERLEVGEKAVIATIITKKGATPREVGTKMGILQDGGTVGTIGGGCAEAEVISIGRRMLSPGYDKKEKFRICKVDLTGREDLEDKMACGGIQDVMLEVVE